jgi:hypothetical protein
MSDKDINAGSFWHEGLWEQLETAKAAIICLTPESSQSRWVHFEAGALAKAVTKACICPYLVDVKVSDLQGPLTFLHGVTADNLGLQDWFTRSMSAGGSPLP